MLSLNELKAKFLVRFPHFKEIFKRVNVYIDDTASTAYTDGYDLYFSSEYMSSLSEEQQLFVFAHELLHVALEHIPRSKGKNPKNWNLATDAVINAYIKSCGIAAPDKLVDIKDALNYSAEQIYEKLQKQDEENKKEPKKTNAEDSGKKGGGAEEVESPDSKPNDDEDKEEKDGKNQSDGKDDKDKKDEDDKSDGSQSGKEDENPGFDDHSHWKDGLKRHEKEEEEKENGLDNDDEKKIDERDEFKKNDNKKNKEDDDYIKDNGDNEPTYGGDSYGGGAGGGTRNKPDELEPTNMIPWQQLLKESVRIDYDYDGSNLEEEDGILITPFEPVERPKTEIVIDSSGSITEDLIKNFLCECLGIIENTETDIGFFGSKFSGFTRVRDKNDIENIEIYDGLGTDFNAAVGAFTNRAENKIIFTDGCAPNPKEYCDAIWVVVGLYKHEINPPGGTVIYITGEEYERLNRRRENLEIGGRHR